MSKIQYSEIEGNSKGFYLVLLVLGGLVGLGALAAFYMEHNGHWVTGMDNQIAWGLPHVFAIFLIVAASGALNVASIGTVFNKYLYKPLGRLSGLLAIALLAGGLVILVLDLGRPDRLIVAMTQYNLTSIFAWNILLYNGFFALVAVYLWTMMDRSVGKYYKSAGIAAFVWRLILTTGTGSIFGFLVARPGYDAAILAPTFIILSFSIGLAIFLLVTLAFYQGTNRELGDAVLLRMKNLLGVFVAATLYFVAVFHVTNLYAAEHREVEKFILAGDSIHTKLFWIGFVIVGSLLPLLFLYSKAGKSRTMIILSSLLVIVGAFSLLYVVVIGGQAKPLEIVNPNEWKVVSSSFGDAVDYHRYNPTLAEFLLGVGGIAMALLIVVFGCKVLRFLPVSLADKVVDPHAASK